MNTGNKNTQGRAILKGPRGGLYVLGTDGKKIRTFKKAPAAAAPAAAPATPRNVKGRVIHTGPSGGKYIIVNGRKVYKFKTAPGGAAASPVARTPSPARSPPPSKKVQKYRRYGAMWVSPIGLVFDRSGKRLPDTSFTMDDRRRFHKNNPGYLKKTAIPFLTTANANDPEVAAQLLRLKLKPGNNATRPIYSGVFFNKNGDLYYVRSNYKKIPVHDTYLLPTGFMMSNQRIRYFRRHLGGYRRNTYPQNRIPPLTPRPPPPPPRRGTPELIENMSAQIWRGGRGGTININRYTMAERNHIARRLKEIVDMTKITKRALMAEANAHRATGNRAEMNRKLELAGRRGDEILAYMRGYRALKPLPGRVASPRISTATPNRFTPASAGKEYNDLYIPLNKNHVVVKMSTGPPIYLSLNSFRGLVKNATQANVAEGNVRNWLRMARRNFPDEKLFAHPTSRRNVTAKNIRFATRA